MEALPELRNSMVAVTTANAEQPRAPLTAGLEYGVVIPTPQPAPQTGCSIASAAAADGSNRGGPDLKAAALAERPWWAQLLD